VISHGEQRGCVMLLADGARADTFEQLLAQGELPEIQRHIVDRGSYRRATSTFTSTTGPAHVPILTGQFAGTANLPGYRWLDRGRYRPGLPAGPWCFRSYNGPEGFFQNRDLSPHVTTLFEACEGAVNVFGVLSRGAEARNTMYRRTKGPLWAYSHYRHDWDIADSFAERALIKGISRMGEFLFCVLPGIDWNCHYVGVDSEAALAAYRRVDGAVGKAAAELARGGRYDSTLLILCSDHGHSAVAEHHDVALGLEGRGLRCAYHSLPVLRRNVDAITAVSGNAMAMIYLGARNGGSPGRGRDWSAPLSREQVEDSAPGILERLRSEPAVDLLVTRLEPGFAPAPKLLVQRRDASAVVHERTGGITYVPLEGDPLGCDAAQAPISSDAALARTFAGAHPDGLVQLAQIFRSPRAGDVVISAAPGFDLRERFERPEHVSSHGGLHREHMLVPVAASAPLADGPIRTADLAPTVLRFLRREPPAPIDGVSRLSAPSLGT